MARSGDRTRRALLAALPLSVALLNAEDADGLLYDRVHRKLNNNLSLRIRDLKVTVVDAVVTIEGIVRSEKLKKRATKVASVKGVKNVVNKLRVGT
ncbi:MAG: BON domain-containing protein [Bryobacterales bacterium]|nr:BON domain-containing protein [Bryobacterales bacterium]